MFNFRGIAPPAIIPFTEKGDIDGSSYRELLDWWIEQGVDAIVACGSTSEVLYLSEEERIKAIEITVDHVDGRVPVIAGTGYPGTSDTIRMMARAKDIGVQAALAITPFYYPLSQEEIEGHFRKLVENVDLPIILYHVPKFTHVDLLPETVERLSNLDQIIGIKESSGDMGSIQRTINLTEGNDFSVLSGSGNLLFNVLYCGGQGGILALANLLPEKCVEINELHKVGKLKQARGLNFRIMDINRMITSKYGIAGVKAAMAMRDLPSGHTRSPIKELSPQSKEELRSELGKTL